jgi:hypothetical protein
MKKCNECNIEMIENASVSGELMHEIGHDAKSRIFINIPTGRKTSFLGLNIDETIRETLKARVCPNCGKVEMYVERINTKN